MAIGEALQSLQNDNEITPADVTETHLAELKADIEACTPEQAAECIAILESAIGRAKEDAADGLQELLDGIEVEGASAYSLNALRDGVDDEKAQAFLKLYSQFIAEDLKGLYGEAFEKLSPTGQETIKLVFWDEIQSQLGFKGAVNMGVGKVTNLTTGFADLFGEANPEATGSILTAHLETKSEVLGKINPDAREDITGMIEVVESLLGTQANNLQKLFELSSGLSSSAKDSIFENPNIISTVLSTGKYAEEGFDINLAEGKLGLGNPLDNNAAQKAFMSQLQTETNGIGGTIEKIQKYSDKFENILGFFGAEGEMDNVKETLFKLPFIGIFFKMIFGDFFNKFDQAQALEKIDSLIEKLANPNQKIALKNLKDTFIPNFLKTEEAANSPLGKVLGTLDDTFYGGISPFLETLESAKVNIKDSQFWTHILQGGAKAGSQEEKIHEYLKGTLESNDITAEKLAARMNSLSADDIPKEEQAGEDAIETADALLDGITSLPADITYKGETLTIEKFDQADSTITIGKRTFQVGAATISEETKFDIEDIGIQEDGPYIKVKGQDSTKIATTELEIVITTLLENGSHVIKGEVDSYGMPIHYSITITELV